MSEAYTYIQSDFSSDYYTITICTYNIRLYSCKTNTNGPRVALVTYTQGLLELSKQCSTYNVHFIRLLKDTKLEGGCQSYIIHYSKVHFIIYL